MFSNVLSDSRQHDRRKIVKRIEKKCMIYMYVHMYVICMYQKHLSKALFYSVKPQRLNLGVGETKTSLECYSRRTDHGDVHEVLAFGTVLSKLVSSQPPGAEAHIVDPL